MADGKKSGVKVVTKLGLYTVNVTGGNKVGGKVGVGLGRGAQAISPMTIARKENRSRTSKRIRWNIPHLPASGCT